MKTFTQLILLVVVVILFCACANNESKNNKEVTMIESKSDELKTGGLYLTKNDDSSYSVSKILVLDDLAVHLRIYSDTFKTKPLDINSDNLKVSIGHAPLAKEGFLMDKPELLKIEKIKESELEGYKMYLDAMK